MSAENVVASARFIPACAGNSPETGDTRHDLTVHPRVCGEQNAQRLIKRQVLGSSPRVRGTAARGEHDPN